VPTVGTFHSIGALILRREAVKVGLSPNFSIYDSDDSENLIKEIMFEMNIDVKQVKPKIVSFMISSAKNELLSPQDYPYQHSGYIEDIVAQIYEKYEGLLRGQNAVDFGDLLSLVVKLFSENPEV